MSWISNPSILWNKDHIYELIPTDSMNYDEKFNAITRLVILITILIFFFKTTIMVIFIGIFTVVTIRYFYKKESFTTFYERNVSPIDITLPTPSNPLMNVLINEYTYNPLRKEAAPSYVPVIDKKITESVKQQNDLDLYLTKFSDYQLDQSMRNFYTTANSTIPNKQGEFADFCYGDMISAKEGNEFALSRQLPRIGGVIS